MKLEFEGEKIRIRKLKLSDAENIYRNIRDKEIVKFTNIPHPYYGKDAEIFIRKSWRGIKNKEYYSFGTALKTDNKIIGGVALRGINWEFKNAEIGYWLGKKFWGKGLGREAIKLIVKFGFEQLKLHRIYGIIFKENIASQKVLEKCGFKLEGELKEEFYRNEKWHNGLIYGLLNN
jgi:RimJ/RimL family protein N-acetyltransferase